MHLKIQNLNQVVHYRSSAGIPAEINLFNYYLN